MALRLVWRGNCILRLHSDTRGDNGVSSANVTRLRGGRELDARLLRPETRTLLADHEPRSIPWFLPLSTRTLGMRHSVPTATAESCAHKDVEDRYMELFPGGRHGKRVGAVDILDVDHICAPINPSRHELLVQSKKRTMANETPPRQRIHQQHAADTRQGSFYHRSPTHGPWGRRESN